MSDNYTDDDRQRVFIRDPYGRRGSPACWLVLDTIYRLTINQRNASQQMVKNIFLEHGLNEGTFGHAIDRVVNDEELAEKIPIVSDGFNVKGLILTEKGSENLLSSEYVINNRGGFEAKQIKDKVMRKLPSANKEMLARIASILDGQE